MTNPAPSWTTPNPSVHYAPGSSLNTPAFTPQQIEAIGQQLVLGFLRWVVQALIGVVTGQNLSGVLAQLSSWSNTLQSDINGAATDVQQAIDNVVQLFGGSGTNNPVSQILSQGKDAINQLVNSLQGLSTGNPFGDFANALQAIPGLNIAGQLRPQPVLCSRARTSSTSTPNCCGRPASTPRRRCRRAPRRSPGTAPPGAPTPVRC
ncbi:hypothetical protein [Mycobacterium branderi]|uniref:PPE family protein n=1 Tax=Mycobacterium branderi TaxID=43348 RepID=A0ABM7KUG1_9MYCO|nr:hypothetical protein MBRA_49920 [Mycobacterium branderi]